MSMPPNRSMPCLLGRRGFLTASLAAVGGLAAMGGCNVVAPVATIIAGPPKRDAQFILPKQRTVVFVDDRQGVIPLRSRQVRRRIGSSVTDVLNTRDELLPGLMIDSGDAIAMADARDRGAGLMSLGQLGQEIGAEVLIAVRVDAFTLRPGGEPRPTAQAAVWILDIPGRTRLFPPMDAREPAVTVTASLDMGSGQDARNESATIEIFFALADALGVEIAKLFYRHEIKELGGRLGVRE